MNAGGLLERTFTAGKYAMQLCAEAYRGWRFADEALPADLIRRCDASHSPLAKVRHPDLRACRRQVDH